VLNREYNKEINMPRFTPHTIAIALGVVALSAVLFLSDDALPGDLLFPVDRFFEEASLKMKFNDLNKARKLVVMADERRDELARIKAAHELNSPEGNLEMAVIISGQILERARVALNSVGTGQEADDLGRELWKLDDAINSLTPKTQETSSSAVPVEDLEPELPPTLPEYFK